MVVNIAFIDAIPHDDVHYGNSPGEGEVWKSLGLELGIGLGQGNTTGMVWDRFLRACSMPLMVSVEA